MYILVNILNYILNSTILSHICFYFLSFTFGFIYLPCHFIYLLIHKLSLTIVQGDSNLLWPYSCLVKHQALIYRSLFYLLFKCKHFIACMLHSRFWQKQSKKTVAHPGPSLSPGSPQMSSESVIIDSPRPACIHLIPHGILRSFLPHPFALTLRGSQPSLRWPVPQMPSMSIPSVIPTEMIVKICCICYWAYLCSRSNEIWLPN